MELETLDKNCGIKDSVFTRYVIPAIEKKRKDFIIRFTNNPNGKSITEKIITLENQMLIKLKVEISYDRYGKAYGIKTKEIKKFSLYDSLGYKMNLQKINDLLLKNIIKGLIIPDIS